MKANKKGGHAKSAFMELPHEIEMKKKKRLHKVLPGITIAALAMASIPFVPEETLAASPAVRVSVHDPSIFKDPGDGSYYVLGSHIASASSKDLINWKQISTDYENVEEAPFYGNLLETFQEPFQWAGYDDGDCSGGNYAVWAPDIIYNPRYTWEDGSKGAYMIYLCTSSTWRRSCIGYMVSKEMNGPYVYTDTLIYSGFTKNGAPDGNSTRNTKWDNDYLNLKELTELGADNGGISGISENWFTDSGDWDNNYAPNAIDPAVFFDAQGERMYMTYGSWSGGLFILELNPATGEAYYPGVDSVDQESGNYTDRYFGTHIAGGNHQSGEAPYILSDDSTGYYYLYETYGGLTADGGYNMRLFRSGNVMGPYLDAAGNNAADSKAGNSPYGIKLMGNYEFFAQLGKKAAGHNSALIDEDGAHYLVHHQRFNISPQTEEHELRLHQQFMNEEQWPVTAVYEYSKEQISHYDEAKVIGTYEFINHGTDSSGEMLITQSVNLNEDGTISGDAAGTWSKSGATDEAGNDKGYDYITLNIGDVTYKGVFFEQTNEADTPEKVMTFTALGNDNTSVWGSMLSGSDANRIEAAIASLDNQVPSEVFESITLPASVMGADVTWEASDPSIIDKKGNVYLPDEETTVTLTATVTFGEASETKEYSVTVKAKAVLVYGYDFENRAVEGSIAPTTESLKQGNAILKGKAAVVTDEKRGHVLEIKNQAGAKGVNYLKLPDDTLSTVSDSGYSVSMWTKVSDTTWEHSALFEADSSAEVPNYPMTRIGVNLIARINANGYSDVQGELLTSNGVRNEWQHIVYTVNPNGIKVYLNGQLAGAEKKNISSCFDDENAASIQKAGNVAVGSGYIWNDEDVREGRFDDIQIYYGTLTEAEILCLYESSVG